MGTINSLPGSGFFTCNGLQWLVLVGAAAARCKRRLWAVTGGMIAVIDACCAAHGDREAVTAALQCSCHGLVISTSLVFAMVISDFNGTRLWLRLMAVLGSAGGVLVLCAEHAAHDATAVP